MDKDLRIAGAHPAAWLALLCAVIVWVLSRV